MLQNQPNLLDDLFDFIDDSPTAYHAIHTIRGRLRTEGYSELEEQARWSLEPGGTYFVTRGYSTLAAFRLGDGSPPDSGFFICGAHTDSPGLKLKGEKLSQGDGALRGSVEVYGGPILSTWLDRELALAGIISVDSADTPRLFDTVKPVAVVPNAAVHLNRDVNKSFEYNKQVHLQAMFGVDDSRKGLGDSTEKDDPGTGIRELIADSLEVDPKSIRRGEYFLHHPSSGTRIGYHPGDDGLIVTGRLDNLAMCHAALTALLRGEHGDAVQMVVFYDNEEIGSRTFQGAGSNFLGNLIRRICIVCGFSEEERLIAEARSFFISADAAHGLHPSYPEKYDKEYSPLINAGPVLKVNGNRRYATAFDTGGYVECVARDAEIPLQEYIIRSDLTSGGTIGALSAASLGIPTVDIGNPIWAMHSIRETGGGRDHGLMIDLLSACSSAWQGRL